MSKSNLLNLIRKTAQELEDAPGVAPRRAPAPAAPPPPNLPPPPPPPPGTEVPAEAPTAKPAAPAPAAPPASVVQMQQQLQSLAKDMTKQVDMSQLGGPDKKPGSEATPDQKQAFGRMSFADFITQHYTRDSDIPGVEFDWDPTKTKMDEKSPSKPTRANVVMDTMQRIGNPTRPGQKPEFAIDGDWGPRTNASLRNAYAMAYGLLEMSRDFKYHPKAYSSRDLAALKELIPHSYADISGAERIKRAKEIVPHLQAIRNLFQETEEHILNKPEFKPYIEGTQAYASYGPSAASDPRMLAELNKKFANMRVMGTVGGRAVNVPITVNDLVSVDTLENWQKKNMPGEPLTNVLSQVKQYLNETDQVRGAAQK